MFINLFISFDSYELTNCIFLVPDVETHFCENGISSTWVDESSNKRGGAVGQVIAEYSTRKSYSYGEYQCRAKCDNHGAWAYNWQKIGSHGCRCYGKAAADSLTLEVNSDWKFCRKNEGNLNKELLPELNLYHNRFQINDS